MLGFGPIGATPIGASGSDLSAEFDVERRIDPGGADDTEKSSIIEVVSFVDRALIERLKRFPGDLRTIDRRRFEELIAELFVGFGYKVDLTSQTRDGGKDIVAISHGSIAVNKYLIECKRPDPGNPVRIATVRSLYGVKADERATKAILVTTTHLTADAKQFVEKNKWEMEAKEFDDVRCWIDDYLKIVSRG